MIDIFEIFGGFSYFGPFLVLIVDESLTNSNAANIGLILSSFYALDPIL